jgi:hypothetical protein
VSLGAYLTGAILCLAWMAWLAWTKELLTLVMVAPVFAYFAARSFLTWGAESGTHFVRNLMGAGKWGGFYYEFANIHLRAAERGDALVFLEADILRVLGQKKSQATQFFNEDERVPFDDKGTAMGLTRAGCQRLLMKSSHADAKKLLTYLEGQAFRPYEKRMERIKGEED